MPQLPSRTVTFLSTDLEGSRRPWEARPEAMNDAVPTRLASRVTASISAFEAARQNALVNTKLSGSTNAPYRHLGVGSFWRSGMLNDRCRSQR